MKRFLVAGMAGAALALAISAGDIFAAPAAPAQAPAAYAAVGPLHGGGRRGPHDGGMALLSATASVTGLTAEQVRAELSAGKSMAQVAQAHGKTAADVIAATRTTYQATLKQAVTSGRLTQAQADAALARFDQSAPQIVNDTTLGQAKRGGPHDGGMTLVGATASVTGLTAEQVRAELSAGKSLAQIAQAHGKTAADVIAAARTTYQATLKQAVTSGRLTQAQADAALARFDQSAPQIVNDTALGQHRGPGKPRNVAPPQQSN